MLNIALADSFHLHQRNFPSLFKVLESDRFNTTTLLDKEQDGFGLITCLGNYTDLSGRVSALMARSIQTQADVFATWDADRLYGAQVAHLDLWPLCRSEMLAYLLSFDNWQTDIMPKDDRAIFDKAFAEDHATLTLNMAAANHWLNHWYDMRADIFKNHFCCIFSGSMIYTRTLMVLLRRSPTRALVMESTFTGNDFLLEEMYHPIANNLGVQHANLRATRRDPALEVPNLYDREVIKARNKVMTAKNKNVVQPPPRDLPRFANDAPQALIVGQVVNDFSLIEDGFPYVSSVPVYREMIARLLEETNCNIIFKAHPWENKKVHLRTPRTFDALAEYVSGLPDDKRARVLLVEDVNMQSLLEDSQFCLTFTSQTGIEAAMLGLKPIVLGHAFYSGAGFTHDCPDLDAVVAAVNSGEGLLDLSGYRAVDRFLVDLFQYGSVSVHGSGERKIAQMLVRHIPLEQKTHLRMEMELGQTALRPRADPSEWSGVLRMKGPLPPDEEVAVMAQMLTFALPDFPGSFDSTDTQYTLRCRVSNKSQHAIPLSKGGKLFNLSYHIFNEAGERVVLNGLMTPLLRELHDSYEAEIAFQTPEEAGKYTIVPALLYTGVCWLDSATSWEFTVA
ncbi:hypothetical protein [uncultured Sulfitobacter sp.]|uniref:capsular polysaccharide export protein, LipB/KpsS family n=1 Tax=uncultured Sulfitobacter sp. TaxID=191468 RepID=UPI00262BCE5E|nr:hypothetical protein [uncultured Sulfitobacter sp.]